MRCHACGKEMRHYRGDHALTELGLDNFVLVGADQWDCACGEHVVEIPHIPELSKAIGKELLNKRGLLSGPEIRFLRKNMGLKGLELAKLMGVDNATLSRWEAGSQPISQTSDRLLRLIYAGKKGFRTKGLIEKGFQDIEPASPPMDRIEIPIEACKTA